MGTRLALATRRRRCRRAATGSYRLVTTMERRRHVMRLMATRAHRISTLSNASSIVSMTMPPSEARNGE